MISPTIIIRHKKENLKKCSLHGLEKRADFLFLNYPPLPSHDFSTYIILKIGAPILTCDDARKGILLIDSTWRYSQIILDQIQKIPNLQYRGLPSNFRTAYPRCQTGCLLPDEGLSSIEALFVAYKILGRNGDFLLEDYYWRELFLQKNKESLQLIFSKPN